MKFHIAKEALVFSLESEKSFKTSVDKVIFSLGSSLQLLGFGEALHGGEEILKLRNKLFQYLVEMHGYSAIVIESSFPRAYIANEYVLGHGPKSYDEIKDTGFGNAFGVLEANRELVEWMKAYNADPKHKTKIRFYGLDIPSGMVGIGSPRQVLHFVLDYLAKFNENVKDRRKKIDELLGDDYAWENSEAHMDPSKSIGLSPKANSLRIETEDFIVELESRRPELIAKTDRDTFLEALQHAKVARGLLNFHASMAKATVGYAERLGIRDALQADNLLYMVSREQGRGKVFAFAHNSHLKKGKAEWQLGPELITWWPAGSLLHSILGNKYAVIGTAVGTSEENGIGKPEEGTLEAQLGKIKDQWGFISTKGKNVSKLPARSSSKLNPTYFPLTAQSFTDFDWLAFVKQTGYNKGGPSLQAWD